MTFPGIVLASSTRYSFSLKQIRLQSWRVFMILNQETKKRSDLRMLCTCTLDNPENPSLEEISDNYPSNQAPSTLQCIPHKTLDVLIHSLPPPSRNLHFNKPSLSSRSSRISQKIPFHSSSIVGHIHPYIPPTLPPKKIVPPLRLQPNCDQTL